MSLAPDRDRFDPAASPLHGRVCFLVGAPRSGTTWVQQLLASHPGIVSSTETHMFNGLGMLLDNQASDAFLLRGWVTREQLLVLTREFADGVLSSLPRKVGADGAIIVEKTPNSPPVAKHLAEVFPDAKFLHLVRDGRDAAYSLRQRFGTTLPTAANQWLNAVTDIRANLTNLDYLEVRYEAIADDPATVLAQVYRWLGVADAEASARAAVAAVDIPVNTDPSVGTIGGARRRAWPAWTGALLVHEMGSELAALGYVSSRTARSVRIVTHPIIPIWRLWERSARRRLAPAAILERRRQRRIDLVTGLTDRLWDAIRSADAAAVRPLLHGTASLTLDGEDVAGDVAAHLTEMMASWVRHDRWAGVAHSMAEFHPDDGGRRLVRLTFRDGKVQAIEITSTSHALHRRD